MFGRLDGESDGKFVGAIVGEFDGIVVGVTDGEVEGDGDGAVLVLVVGNGVGVSCTNEGANVGD